MKKLIIVLVLLFAAAALFGQAIKIGTFPSGKWLDSNYDAIWEFSNDNGIRILDSKTGDIAWDFAGKTINDFKITMDGSQPVITFSCTEADRSYYFKPALSGNVTMEIERPNLPKYSVSMKKQ